MSFVKKIIVLVYMLFDVRMSDFCQLSKNKMISFFLSFIRCEDYYVSYNNTAYPYLATVNESRMWKIVNSSEFVAVLVAPSDRYEILEQHIAFAGASTLFQNNGPFLFVDAQKRLKLTQKYLVTPPALFLFKNHSLWLACPYPMSEIALLFTLKRFYSQTVDTADTLKDIYATLGRYRYTLITPPDLLDKTLDLRFKVAPYLGAMDIIVSSKKNLMDLNASVNEICLFRLEDHAIQPIEPDFDDFFNYVTPIFKKYIYEDLAETDRIIVAMMSDECTTEQEEYLYDMSIKYPNLQFGWLSRDLRYIAERSCLLSFKDGDNFIAFDPVNRGFYDNEKYKSYCFQYPFSRGDYNRSFTNYFDDITSGKLKIKYHCENVTEAEEKALVQKLNANSYEHFLRNRVADLVVLYLRSTLDNENDYYINLLQTAAEKLVENNITNIRFGYITTVNNSGLFKYPYIYEFPNLRFYPHQNQSELIPFPHEWTSDDIVRFICRVMRPPVKADFVPKKNEDEFKGEAGRFVRFMSTYSKDESQRLTQYFKEMWLELDIPIGVKIENDAFPENDPELQKMKLDTEENKSETVEKIKEEFGKDADDNDGKIEYFDDDDDQVPKSDEL